MVKDETRSSGAETSTRRVILAKQRHCIFVLKVIGIHTINVFKERNGKIKFLFGMVVHNYNSSTREEKAEESRVQDQPRLYSKTLLQKERIKF
jgi:hypothetical protein